MHSDYIAFVDESGDHSLDKIDPAYPMFVLAFCVMPFAAYNEIISPAIRKLKFDLFGHDTVVLHETDIVRRRKAFASIGEVQRNDLMSKLGEIIRGADMTIIAIAIHKQKHAARYKAPAHPYHLAMQYGLERLHSHMEAVGQRDRLTHVVCERRGEREDAELELAFRRVCDGQNASGQRLCFDIVMADKKCNSEGLQISDLVARPIGRHVLNPEQPNKAYEVIEKKLAVSWRGSYAGWGLKVFP
ncbi:conserved hypothetical protein [Burkholderiales bacterium 8X]|nr:conserved hypothetical protein [Burkholderiales bacterium 8X]